MSLELFDFPPIWFVFDAHSLWYCISFIPVAYFSRHLCTAVFGYFLGSVQIEDLVIANGERLDDQPPVKFDKNFCKVDSINSKKSR